VLQILYRRRNNLTSRSRKGRMRESSSCIKPGAERRQCVTATAPLLMALTNRLIHRCGAALRVHSQIRITFHPLRVSCAETIRSRCRFLWIFSVQASAFVFGRRFRPQSWPCQKQPSRKTATFSERKARSGLPNRCSRRLQPLIPLARSKATNLISVVALASLRIRDIRADRDNPPKEVLAFFELSGQRDIRSMRVFLHERCGACLG
jgi:hypothetical protein